MDRIFVHQWVGFSRLIAEMMPDLQEGDVDYPIGEEVRQRLVERPWEGLKETCISLGMPLAARTLERLDTCVARKGVTWREVGDLLKELQGRVEDELEGQLFFHLDNASARYFDAWRHGWDATLDKFASTSSDIEEASKCLALKRGTACVFHLTRVLQAGLYVLADDLGLTPTSPDWQITINEIQKEIDNRRKAGPGVGASAADKAAWKEQVEFHAAAAAQFMYIKDAFRNRTVHGTGYVFTEERALTTYSHTQEFMEHLATRLKELVP